MLGEPGPRVDLDQQLGQVDLREARFDQLPQPAAVPVGAGIVLGQIRL